MASREKRKERVTRERTAQILDAAMSVFSSRGFGEATMADIAKEAGIGVGTIYNYYKDKHDLLTSLIADTLISPDLARMLSMVSVPRSMQDNTQFMAALLEERLGFALKNAPRLLFLFFEVQRDAELRKQYVTQVLAPLLNTIERYIRTQVRRGNFRKVDERVIARTLVGAVIGNAILYRLELKGSPLKKSGIQCVADELSGLFMGGLANR